MAMSDTEAIGLLNDLDAETEALRQEIIGDYGDIGNKEYEAAKAIRDIMLAAHGVTNG